MHSPDEEAPEEQRDGEVILESAAPPLYEFPAAPPTGVLPEALSSPTPVRDEPAAPGFIYPPPPSFYEKMATPLTQAPLPSGGYGIEAPVQASPGGPKVYPPPPGGPFLAPPVKKARKWPWIVSALVGTLLLVACGLCGWGAYTFISPLYQEVAGAVKVADDYYANLQARDYHAAYADLAPQDTISGLSEQQFTSQASERDGTYGPVNSYVLEQPTFRTDPNNGPDLSHFTISVDVKRSHLSYTVALSVAKIGNDWKITDYSRL